MSSLLERLLGLHASVDALTWGQFAARTVMVFVLGIVLVRIADRRFLGRNAGFDVLLAIVLGSVLSRAINGQAPFFQTMGVSVLLVLLHRLVGALACRWSAFSKLIKGDAIVLVKDGVRRREAMRHADISEDDLEENLRVNANVANAEDVAEARLERNGLISAVRRGRNQAKE